jgi:hypothetical protein
MENNSVPIFYSNTYLDEALTKGLDPEGLARLKAVELAIHFSMNKGPSVKDFDTLYTNIYKFITTKNNNE